MVSRVRRVATRTVDCCLEHERQTSNLPWSAEDLAAIHQHRDELSWRSDAWGRPRLIQLSDVLQTGMPVQNILYIDILKAGGKRRAAKATSIVLASPSW